MKILFFAPFPPPLHGHSLMSRIAYDGLTITDEVVKIDTTMEREFAGNKLKSLSSFSHLKRILSTLRSDLRVARRERYSLAYMAVGISFRAFMRYAPYMWWARMSSTPYVLHTHGSTFADMYRSCGWLGRAIVRSLVSRASRVIVLSESLVPTLAGVIPDERIAICHNCVEEYLFISDVELEAKLEDHTPIRLLFLSNVMRAKGIVELMDAFERLDGRYRLDIAGAIEPDEQLAECFREFCDKYSDRVTYHGRVEGDKKRDILKKSDIFVLPSKNEGQPVSILEAYAMGLAVVTDESIGGIRDIFTSNVNGITCYSESPQSIAEAIAECQREMERFTKSNCKIARESYTQSSFNSRLSNILRDCETVR